MPGAQAGLFDLALASPGADPERLTELLRVDAEFTLDSAGLPAHPAVCRGDVWLCGPHRVACGDATSAADVARAMGGMRPALMVTDPPYGVEYDPSWREKTDLVPRKSVGKVIGDNQSDWREAWSLFPGDVAYIWHAGKYASSVQTSLEIAAFEIRSQIIWCKNRIVFGRGNYHWQHEPCWYAVRKGQKSSWSGGHDQSTVWHIANSNPFSGKRGDVTGHGTQKPLECMRRPIANHDAPCVYDPFLGSGTTLIAAEIEGRACVGVELNPLYVYIAIDRWQKATGTRATLEATGETLAEVATRRANEPEPPAPVAATSPVKPSHNPVAHANGVESNAQMTLAAALSAPAASPALKPVEITPRGPTRAPVISVVAPPPKEKLDDPFLAHHEKTLRLAGNAPIRFDDWTWDYTNRGAAVGVDCEVFPNFFCVCFKRFNDGKRLAFELSERSPGLDRDGITRVLRDNVIISFNGRGYDEHILAAALTGATNTKLFELSQRIVVRGERPQEKSFSPRLDHVDLLGVLPQGRRSLKEIHGRLHGRFLVDLPFPPDHRLSPAEMNIAILYCMNDVDALEALRNALVGPLTMRTQMGKRYGIELRSKSDAQVGEDVFRARMKGKPSAPQPVDSVHYAPPPFLRFERGELRSLTTRLSETTFAIDSGGHVVTPDWMDNLTLSIGDSEYAMGVGGLHSREKSRALFSDGERFLLDVDVGSQYPKIILALGLYPKAVGPEFVNIYREMVEERLEAKRAGDTVRADGLKIAANGSGFGKSGSPYSFLYAPHTFLATTLTGQLSLLMLIERAETAGIAAVSANTDGVIFHCPWCLEVELDAVLGGWERDVAMEFERTRYSAIYQRDVNTYIAFKENGGTKRKGWVANYWNENDHRGMLSHNPQMTVVSDAVVAHLGEGKPIEEHISTERDPRAFVTLVKVSGGASWRGKHLGRCVRWYWSQDGEPIVYADSGNKVSKTEGARPMMELPHRVPADLDRLRYVDAAEKLLVELGAKKEPGLL